MCWHALLTSTMVIYHEHLKSNGTEQFSISPVHVDEKFIYVVKLRIEETEQQKSVRHTSAFVS